MCTKWFPSPEPFQEMYEWEVTQKGSPYSTYLMKHSGLGYIFFQGACIVTCPDSKYNKKYSSKIRHCKKHEKYLFENFTLDLKTESIPF